MRVIICRAAPDGEAIASRLRAAGHEPIVAPVLVIKPMHGELPDGLPDAVLTTSAHAVPALRPQQIQRLVSLPVYAVGQRSAAIARHSGFKDVRVGAGDARALVDLVTLTLPRSKALLHLAGRIRKPDLWDGLIARGYTVGTIEVYDTIPAPPWNDTIATALRNGGAEACLHFSAHSARLALAAARVAGVADAFSALLHCCIAEDTARVLRQAGIMRAIVAGRPDAGGVLACLSSG